MFDNKQLNQKMKKIKERALRITYKDTEATLVTIRTKNLEIFMYTTKNELNPSFMQEIFCEVITRYNLRGNNEFI